MKKSSDENGDNIKRRKLKETKKLRGMNASVRERKSRKKDMKSVLYIVYDTEYEGI